MGKGIGVFVAGLLIGALSGRATARFSRAQLSKRDGANGRGRTESLMAKRLDRDQAELGNWSGKVSMGKQISEQALAQAPMGWY